MPKLAPRAPYRSRRPRRCSPHEGRRAIDNGIHRRRFGRASMDVGDRQQSAPSAREARALPLAVRQDPAHLLPLMTFCSLGIRARLAQDEGRNLVVFDADVICHFGRPVHGPVLRLNVRPRKQPTGRCKGLSEW